MYKILTAKKQNPKTDTTQIEHQIDHLVYKLYNLTKDEIKIIEMSKGVDNIKED